MTSTYAYRPRWRWAGVALLLMAGAGLIVAFSMDGRQDPPAPPVKNPSPTPAAGWFEDCTATTGVQFTYRNGAECNRHTILESLGGGVALLDFNGDGLLDIFVTGGGTFGGPDSKQIIGYPSRLYQNLGNWRFRDVTEQVGLDQPVFYSHGCAVGDYDNDGWPDLLVTGWGALVLYHNEPDGKGGRHFVNVTEKAGLRQPQWATSAAWADLDGDGFADLYVCQYVDWSFTNDPPCLYRNGQVRDLCPPSQFKALPHQLWRNQRNGTFVEAAAAAGLHTPDALIRGKGLGVLIADLNDDGRPDIYVANDASGNLLYVNRGSGRFDELGMVSGVRFNDRGTADGSMGIACADYNGTGRPSLLVSNYENQMHALYRNDGKGQFSYQSQAAGLGRLGRQWVGFGIGFGDFDRDGWEDLVIVHGHVLRLAPTLGNYQQKPFLFRNQGDGAFADASGSGGAFFGQASVARGLALGDLDNDGALDLVVSRLNEPIVILRNVAAPERSWLGIELRGKGRRDVVGAKLTLTTNGTVQTRFAQSGGSYLSSGDRRHLFGLGAAAKAGRLTVHWPGGAVEHWDDLGINRYWVIEGGNKEAQPPAHER